MDSLRTAIDIFFRRYSIDVPIDAKILSFVENPFQNGDGKFEEYGRIYYPFYSKDEWGNVSKRIEEQYLSLNLDNIDSRKRNLFNLIFNFANKHIEYKGELPDASVGVVPLERLLSWRDLSHKLGEDLFTSAHRALFTHLHSVESIDFNWNPNIGINKNDYSFISEWQFTENHFHLKGSIPVFEVSWISLMNRILGRSSDFNRMESGYRQNELFVPSFSLRLPKLYKLVIGAAAIRLILYSFLVGIKEPSYFSLTKRSQFIRKIRDGEIALEVMDIQNHISAMRYGDDHIAKFPFYGSELVVDYGIQSNDIAGNSGYSTLAGERRLLYGCFKRMLEDEFSDYEELLYIYLLIKARFREELIQVNNKVGFENFSNYQDRKEFFIPENSIYEELALSMAVKECSEAQNIGKFELRVAPKPSVRSQLISIKRYDRQIEYWKRSYLRVELGNDNIKKEDEKNYFYVLHFIKHKDKLNRKSSLVRNAIPRHYYLRQDIKKEAHAIWVLRKSKYSVSNRVYGIDAASSEFNARPEVFAQAFRFLNNSLNKIENPVKPRFGMTYHAGEDFYDIIDGLRTIDECIKFLFLGDGDRIGHALALGIQPFEYFNFKHRKLFIPKQVLFDNVVWFLKKIEDFGIENDLKEIRNILFELFKELRYELYSNKIRNKFGEAAENIENFYKGWLLRGNNPDLYKNYKEYKYSEFSDWQKCNIIKESESTQIGNANKDEVARFIYHLYHFDSSIEDIGNRIHEFKISNSYMHAVGILQTKYLKYFSKLNIAIETNPTSNYLIGTFKRYAKHPILRFYPPSFDDDNKNGEKRIKVSINTDDQGVFNTSISNEFALLFAALKFEEDEEGNRKYNEKELIDWLETIKKESGEMSFKEDAPEE